MSYPRPLLGKAGSQINFFMIAKYLDGHSHSFWQLQLHTLINVSILPKHIVLFLLYLQLVESVFFARK